MITRIHRVGDRNLFEVEFDLGAFSQQGRQMIVTGEFSDWAIQPSSRTSGFVAPHRPMNTIALRLPGGSYQYKYYDLQHSEWMEVDRYPEIYRGFHWDFIWNPFGTLNCIIRLG